MAPRPGVGLPPPPGRPASQVQPPRQPLASQPLELDDDESRVVIMGREI